MKISIFGLGYVGAVSAGCLAEDGHTVIGVDPVPTKVDLINSGKSPIIEKDISELIEKNVANGRLRATSDVTEAITQSDLSLICVGTPSKNNGDLDLTYVKKVCAEIGAVLATKDDFHVVVARSTMLPGSMRDVVIPALNESSGKTAGIDFGVCNNPEFLREGTAVYDYRNPPKTVVGETDKKSGDILCALYENLDAPLIRTDVATAEMVKYTDNAWHAVKVGFANEIGNICKEVNIDGGKVMEIFCHDTKLNLSPYYLRPGFAFGGSCLPKDLRALGYKSKMLDLELPILGHVLRSNELQVERGLEMILSKEKRKVGFLGFSFKAGTDDLRESPVVELIERLIGKGYDLALYDKNVSVAKLVGANRDFILNRIPHISNLMVEAIDEVIKNSEVIVIGTGDPAFADIGGLIGEEQHVVDLTRVADKMTGDPRYDGICW
jgi:GDP-mannose 6-dehydrogenase